VLLHGVVTLLLAKLFLRLALPPPAAIGAALLFAVHPIHVEAVTSVVGRGETQAAALSLGFVLWSLMFMDRRPRRGLWLALALTSYLLACLTKESAAAAPGILFLCLMWRDSATEGRPPAEENAGSSRRSRGSLVARGGAALRRGLPVYAGCAALLLGVFWARGRVLGGALKAARTGIFELENPLAPLPVVERIRNASGIFCRYLGRMAFPLRLTSDESAWTIPLFRPHEWLGWACPALLVALLIASLWRLRWRVLAALGFLLLCVASLPTANLAFPTGTIFAERVAYLPSAGFCLIAAGWIVGAARRADAIARWRWGVLAALALALAGRTVIRNPVWESDETLFTDMVRVSPGSAKAHYDFAYMSAERGSLRRGLEHYIRATQIYPKYWDAWAGRGRMERLLGNPAAAEAAYAESVRLAPFAENGYFGLGLAREDRGNRAGAEEAYREGLRRHPMSLPLAYRMALLLSAQKRPGAEHAWHRALTIEPGSLPARLGYAEWLAAAGRSEEARCELAEVLRRSPRYAPALRLEKSLGLVVPPKTESKIQNPKSKIQNLKFL
jgi:tetratricopeptide (TPR) repeat protein